MSIRNTTRYIVEVNDETGEVVAYRAAAVDGSSEMTMADPDSKQDIADAAADLLRQIMPSEDD